jgi:hypothetical protein
MPSLRPMCLVGLTILTHDVAAPQPEFGLPNLVLELADDSLMDVAVAVYTPYRGIIYYNPDRARQLGPDLSAFFRAHEFGHLYYHHTRASAMAGQTGVALESLARTRELEADCYAARTLRHSQRHAVESAIRFFRLMGPVRLDAEHPDGATRAGQILSCSTLPPPDPR